MTKASTKAPTGSAPAELATAPKAKKATAKSPAIEVTKTAPKAADVNLSQKQVMALFGITHMTAYNWRTKEVSGRPPLPHKADGRDLTFSANKVTAWATKHGVPLATSLDKVMKLGLENKSSGRPASAKPKAKAA